MPLIRLIKKFLSSAFGTANPPSNGTESIPEVSDFPSKTFIDAVSSIMEEKEEQPLVPIEDVEPPMPPIDMGKLMGALPGYTGTNAYAGPTGIYGLVGFTGLPWAAFAGPKALEMIKKHQEIKQQHEKAIQEQKKPEPEFKSPPPRKIIWDGNAVPGGT